MTTGNFSACFCYPRGSSQTWAAPHLPHSIPSQCKDHHTCSVLPCTRLACLVSCTCHFSVGEVLLLLLLSRFSRVWLCATPQMAAHQASLSLGFSRQEHWSGLPFPPPMHESENWKWSHSVVSDSLRPHGLQPTRLLCPWDLPGKSTSHSHYLLFFFMVFDNRKFFLIYFLWEVMPIF